ncbi:nucleotide exchange factor GrpE [bacterium]|nr:nucleotide exchange factor GrpE [bacterium]MBU1024596.1 nucleotide exchange factor GrpE [bacterium]
MNPEKEKNKSKKRVRIDRDEKKISTDNDDLKTESESEDSNMEKDQEKTPSSKEELTPDETIAQLADKIEKLSDDLLRERASIINYRKRMEEEKGLIRRYGASDLAFDLLNVLDYFEESLKFESSDMDSQAILQGVKFTVDEMHKILAKHGIKEIETDSPFNPKLHEAFGTMETDDHEPGKILQIHRKGYMYKDRVLRAAMVTVSKVPDVKKVDDNYEKPDKKNGESPEPEVE